jgi:predicted RNA-binding protein
LDDEDVVIIAHHEDGVTCRNVADPLKVSDAERDVETEETRIPGWCGRVKVQCVRIGRVVVDKNPLALRNSRRESNIIIGGELNPLRG